MRTIDCAAWSIRKEKWYDRVLVFESALIPAEARRPRRRMRRIRRAPVCGYPSRILYESPHSTTAAHHFISLSLSPRAIIQGATPQP